MAGLLFGKATKSLMVLDSSSLIVDEEGKRKQNNSVSNVTGVEERKEQKSFSLCFIRTLQLRCSFGCCSKELFPPC